MCFDVCACSARVRRSPSPVTTPQRRVQRRRAPEQAVEVEAAAAACKTTLLWRGRARPRLCPAGRVSTAWTTRVNLTLTGSAYCHLDEKFEFWFLLIEMQLCDLQPWFQKVGMLSLKTIICAIIFKQRTTLIWIHVVTSFMQTCVSQSGGPHSILTSEQGTRKAAFIRSHDTSTCQLTSSPVEFSKQVFLSMTHLSQFSVATVPTCLHQNEHTEIYRKVVEVKH